MAELTLNWPSGPCRRRKIGKTWVEVDPLVWTGPGPEPAHPLQIIEHYALTKKEEEKQLAIQQASKGTIFDGTAYWIFEREGEAPPRPVHKCAVQVVVPSS